MGIDDRPNTGSDISAPRRGLGTIRDAIRLRPFNIGYLGASVTAQRSGYVAPLHAELVRRTGQAHQAIVAAIGGLGSISGAFLMDDLLRDRTPDLCFVEFTTTDVEGYTPLHQVGPAVEGILRKLIRQGVQPVLLHLFRIDTEYGPGNPVISAYERVAEHYGVPSINLAEQWMRDQAWSQGAYLRDSVHLSEAGAVVCAGQILDELLALPEGSGPDESAAEGPPLHHDAYDGTTIVRAKVKMLDQRAAPRDDCSGSTILSSKSSPAAPCASKRKKASPACSWWLVPDRAESMSRIRRASGNMNSLTNTATTNA